MMETKPAPQRVWVPPFDLILRIMGSWNTDYGRLRFIRSKNSHSNDLYVEFYNAGWSENEELEQDIPQHLIVVSKHPITLIRFKPSVYAPLYNMTKEEYEHKMHRIECFCCDSLDLEKYEVSL